MIEQDYKNRPDFCYQKVDKGDFIVRYAFWKIYGKKCFIDGQPLTKKNMDLDHLINEKIGDNELEILKKKIGLNSKFHVNSLVNFRPIKRKFNREKSNLILPISAYIHEFSRTFNNAEKIHQKIQKMKNEDLFSESLMGFEISAQKDSLFNTSQNILQEMLSNERLLNNIEDGIAFWQNKKFQEADLFFNNYLEYHPNDKLGYFYSALCQLQLDKKEKALNIINNAINIDNKFKPFYLLKGYIFLNLKKYAKVLKLMEEVLKTNKHNSLALTYKGHSLQKLGRFKDAKETINQAFLLNPSDEKIVDLMLQYYEGDNKEGFLLKLIQRDPNNSHLYFRLGIHLLFNEPNKAIINLIKYRDLIEKNGDRGIIKINNFINLVKNSVKVSRSLNRLIRSLNTGFRISKNLIQLRKLCNKLHQDFKEIVSKYESKVLLSMVRIPYINNNLRLFESLYNVLIFREDFFDELYGADFSSPFKKFSYFRNDNFFILDLKFFKEKLQHPGIDSLENIDERLENFLLDILKFTQNRVGRTTFESYYRFYKFEVDEFGTRYEMSLEEQFKSDLSHFENHINNIDKNIIDRNSIIEVWKAFGDSLINRILKKTIIQKKIKAYKKIFPQDKKINRLLQLQKFKKVNKILNEKLRNHFGELFKNMPNGTKWMISSLDF